MRIYQFETVEKDGIELYFLWKNFRLTLSLNLSNLRKSEEYILSKPEPFKSILIYLQLRIEQQYPKVQLKYKWHLPFYYIEDKPFCYLNYTKGYVDLAFMCGKHLTKHLDKLNGEKRVLVKSLRYKSLEEINDKVLNDVLKEAYILTENK